MQLEDSTDAKKDPSFICGVVEGKWAKKMAWWCNTYNLPLSFKGFYGRPWTLDQRKDLFIKLQEWGMNSYLYAPKDDYKHVILFYS